MDRDTVYGLFQQSLVFIVGMTAILASLGVILCATPIYSALYLIGNMVCLALLFLLFNAEFLAVVQQFGTERAGKALELADNCAAARGITDCLPREERRTLSASITRARDTHREDGPQFPGFDSSGERHWGSD